MTEQFPNRFATLETAQAFQASFVARKPDYSLCVPLYVSENGAGRINPAWITAPYEWALVIESEPHWAHGRAFVVKRD